MGLKKIILNNFKSYAGTLEIPFDGTPFVAIVGPNGSGKSNLLDAICFLIGMDSTQLRGSELGDLVHNGGSRRRSNDHTDMFVSAIVTSGETENEVSTEFKRTISEYLIDDDPVDAQTYLSKWAELKVFPDARNCVVLQGDIENLAGADSRDLAQFIENLQLFEYAQLDPSKIREECVQLEADLEKASKDIRKRANTRRAAQAQADEAMELSQARERLSELRMELKQLERRRRQMVLLEKRAILAEMQRKSEEALARLEACRAEAQLVDADSRKLRAEYAKKRRQLLKSRSAEVEAQELLTTAEAEYSPLQKKQEAIEAEIRLMDPDLEYSKQSLATAEAEVKSAETALKLLDKSQNRELSRNNSAENADPTFQNIPQKLKDLWSKLENEFMSETALDQDTLECRRRQAQLASQKQQSKERQIEDLKADVASAAGRVKQRELRVQQLKALVDERAEQQQQRREELTEVADELQALRSERKDMSAKLKELTDRVRTTDGNKRAMAQRYRLLDAVERLRRTQRGKVHDLLGNLVQPTDSKFAAAVERAMGSNADAIVVDDSGTAIECIAQARKERLGTLSFLPLSDLRTRDIMSARAQLAHQSANRNANNPQQAGFEEARLLVDCAQFDPLFRPAVAYAMGDTVFAPSFQVGLNLRKSGLRMRIIDAFGSSIAANNIMSASPNDSSSGSNSASDRSLAAMQRKAQGLAEKLKLEASRETELTDKEIRLTAQIDRAVQTIDGAKSELRVNEEYLNTALAEAQNLENAVSAEMAALDSLRQCANEAQASLDELMQKLNEVRTNKFSSFISEAGGTLSEWDSVFSRGAQRFAELSRQRQRLEDRLQLATERRDAASSQLTHQKQRFRALQTALERNEEAKARVELDHAAARQRVERAQARVRTLRSETEEKSDAVGEAESATEAANLRVTEAEREEHRHALALASEIGKEQASLDAEADEDEEGGKVTSSSDEANEINADSSDVEAEHDSSSAQIGRSRKRRQPASRAATKKSRTQTKKSAKDTLSLDRLDAKLNDLRAEIEPLARLCALAGAADNDEDAAATASQRCSELDETVDSARSRTDKLATQLAVLKQQRNARFNSTLGKIQQTLASIYSELVGGDSQAKLTSINSEASFEGIEFIVMPPGKTFTPISHLSGGERSMAALALLFTFQRLYPAPFVILDEVDAALDFVNVASFSRYVQKHSADTQFLLVSLKQRLFQTASHLIGVYKEKVQSKTLTVPL